MGEPPQSTMDQHSAVSDGAAVALLRRARRLPERLEHAVRLDRPAAAIAGVVGRLVPAGARKDALSGTLVGHPVHPPLTDLPIGFWTSAWALDLIGGHQSRDAARRLVGLGVLSAIPTAVTGASDWGDTTGAAQRVGLVHAAANSVALACYGASWFERHRGHHRAGVAWGWVGATAATAGGFLGGHLVNALGVGVDNTAFDDAIGDWTAAAPVGDADGPVQVVEAAGVAILVAERDGHDHAVADRCTHRGGPLHEGEVTRGCVECPWHASVFRLADGEVVRGPATRPQPHYDVRTTSGSIEVRRSVCSD